MWNAEYSESMWNMPASEPLDHAEEETEER